MKSHGQKEGDVCYLFIGERSSDRARTAWRNEVAPIGIYSSGEFKGGESRSSLAITRSRCWKNARVIDGVASFDGLRSRENGDVCTEKCTETANCSSRKKVTKQRQDGLYFPDNERIEKTDSFAAQIFLAFY